MTLAPGHILSDKKRHRERIRKAERTKRERKKSALCLDGKTIFKIRPFTTTKNVPTA